MSYYYGSVSPIARAEIYNKVDKKGAMFEFTGKYLPAKAKIGVTDRYIDSEGYTWCKHAEGWSKAAGPSGEVWITIYPLAENYGVLYTRSMTDNEAEEYFAQVENVRNTGVSSGTVPSSKTMRLFGSPFQFNKYADHRSPSISNFIGKKYMERIVAHAPVITIIPGVANYLPDASDKEEDSAVLLNLIKGDDGTSLGHRLKTLTEDHGPTGISAFRYYNFKADYAGYIDQVNLTCRQMAVMLNLNCQLPEYNTSENGSMKTELKNITSYRWQNYRWDARTYSTVEQWRSFVNAVSDAWGLGGSGFFSNVATQVAGRFTVLNAIFDIGDELSVEGVEGNDKPTPKVEEKLENAVDLQNYVQFYIDPSQMQVEDSFENETSASKLKGIFEGSQSTIKELAFIANSAGLGAGSDLIEKFADDANANIQETLNSMFGNNTLKGMLGNFTTAATNVIMGHNVVIPDIYQGSRRDSSKMFTIKLQSPYAHPLSIYLNILVPMAYLLNLVCPRNKTPNTYDAPPLVKVYCDGIFSCSLGIIENLTITKDGEFTADGLPTAVTARITVKDLYPEISMNTISKNGVALYMHNSSLIEYLMTQCGLSLVSPNYKRKLQLRWNATYTRGADYLSNITAQISQNITGNMVDIFNGVV